MADQTLSLSPTPRLAPPPGRTRQSWRRFRRRPAAMAGLFLVAGFVVLAVVGPFVTGDPAAQDYGAPLAPPSGGHLLGTDDLGRDLPTRIAYGARVSLEAGVPSVLMAMLAGVPIGLLAGYYRRFLDPVVMRLVDLVLAFPFLTFAVGMAAILGPSLRNVVIALGVSQLPAIIRVTRGEVLVIREMDYVAAAVADGAGDGRVRCVLRLTEPTAATIHLGDRDITHLSRRALRPLRRDVHMVFQDPYSSLNPRFTVGQIVAEPLRRHGLARGGQLTERVREMLERVGLGAEMRGRRPHELSGGQRQRVGPARALVLEPKLVVADEPVSALDVSVRASVLNLIADLQRDMGFSCLFITHDLSVVEFLADRIAVMYLGRIVETGPTKKIFAEPQHPYTQALLSHRPCCAGSS